jgi:TATA-box binding protein (TBP) (component of TFIID and TFIIIB)
MAVIRNIVLVGKMEGLSHISMPASSANFNGIKIRLPNSTCLLFRNGAVTIVGVKSLDEVKKIPNYLLTMFPNACFAKQSNGDELKICNIMATTDFGQKVNLGKLYESERCKTFITYTPETFPGMKITLRNCLVSRNSLVAIVFHSGKIVITGALTSDEILFAEKEILSKIQQSI